MFFQWIFIEYWTLARELARDLKMTDPASTHRIIDGQAVRALCYQVDSYHLGPPGRGL